MVGDNSTQCSDTRRKLKCYRGKPVRSCIYMVKDLLVMVGNHRIGRWAVVY